MTPDRDDPVTESPWVLVEPFYPFLPQSQWLYAGYPAVQSVAVFQGGVDDGPISLLYFW